MARTPRPRNCHFTNPTHRANVDVGRAPRAALHRSTALADEPPLRDRGQGGLGSKQGWGVQDAPILGTIGEPHGRGAGRTPPGQRRPSESSRGASARAQRADEQPTRPVRSASCTSAEPADLAPGPRSP
jgi:hypothetical protein